MAENDGDEWNGPDLEDDSGAVMRAVSRQIKLWREAAGMTQTELGKAIGYGEDMVSAVERCRRLPSPEFLDNADEALGAGGRLSAMKEDVRRRGTRRRCGTSPNWRRRPSSGAPTATTTSMGCCRRRSMRERCMRCGAQPSARRRSTGTWPVGWDARRSSSVVRRP
ncbi:hypothetical protein TPA0909_11940 [Streptomyces albus]|nr:hypothetical protein TPA0909_11940 [Streptomyces albus]